MYVVCNESAFEMMKIYNTAKENNYMIISF